MLKQALRQAVAGFLMLTGVDGPGGNRHPKSSLAPAQAGTWAMEMTQPPRIAKEFTAMGTP